MQKYIGMMLLPHQIRLGDFIHQDGEMVPIKAMSGVKGNMTFTLENGKRLHSTLRKIPIFRYY